MSTNPSRSPVGGLGYVEVSATQFAKSFGKFEVMAARQPVAVTSHKRITGYYISTEDFAHYQRLREHERKVYRTEELPESTWKAIKEAQYPSGFEDLDDLMEDSKDNAIKEP
jgi:PHD/YefM family antitoxin component YafN of YafNO toxin-antitoxin module